MGWRDQASVAAYRGGWRAVRLLPERVAYRSFDALADAAWARRGKGPSRLRANLARVVGPDADLDAITRQGMRHYLRYWCEVFRLPDWDAALVDRRLRVSGEANLREPLAAGRGLVGAVPHMGNWDHGGAWVCQTGVSITTVAERLEPEEVFEEFLEFRQRLGMQILPLSGGDVDVFATLAGRVRANGFVPLLADRDLTARGLPVTFFGERATMPAGPAALALRTGAPLVPVALWSEGTPPNHVNVLHFGEPLEMPAGKGSQRLEILTQKVADFFADHIAAHPADWHMLQKVFSADLTPP
jgi:KDO2-lipid IV(A) lauroyltransferase